MRITIYVQDPIVMKKDDDNNDLRFAERIAQCILGECGPLIRYLKHRHDYLPWHTFHLYLPCSLCFCLFTI